MSGLGFDAVKVTPLARISVAGGDVMHAMKTSDDGFAGFGEAYFSWIQPGAVKAWKRHTRMTLNLVVPVGHIRLVFAADSVGPFATYNIGTEADYARLTVSPGVWFGFQGRSGSDSLLLNIASIVHDRSEAETRGPGEFQYDWT